MDLKPYEIMRSKAKQMFTDAKEAMTETFRGLEEMGAARKASLVPCRRCRSEHRENKPKRGTSHCRGCTSDSGKLRAANKHPRDCLRILSLSFFFSF